MLLRTVDYCGGQGTGFFGAVAEDLVYVVEVVFEFGALGAGFGKIFPVVLEEGFLRSP